MQLLAPLLWILLSFSAVNAAEDPTHAQLRSVRTEIIAAITKGDIDTVLRHAHPNVVVTWQNAEVCRGRDGLKDFFERMGRHSFKGYKVPPTPDELTILHGGDTGISFGETVGEFSLMGRQYEIKSRWTATLVKENDQWLLASYHISMNTLDNPLLNTAKNGVYAAGGVALVIGMFIGRVLFKKRAAI